MTKYLLSIAISICYLVLICFTSCIKEEGVYREAEILQLSLTGEDADNLLNVLYRHDRRIVTVIVKDTTGYSNRKIVIDVKASPKATISPTSGAEVQLNNYQTFYTVEPESKEKTVTYLVDFVAYKSLKFDFEDWKYTAQGARKFYQPADPAWSTANGGLRFIFQTNTPFPTRPSGKGWVKAAIYPEEENIIAPSNNSVAILETCLGKTVIGNEVPIFPGSLYLGTFNLTINWEKPALNALFGQPHPYHAGKPIMLKGFYQYKSGSKFQTFKANADGKNVVEYVEGKKDQCDIYAILFRVTKGAEGLKEFLTAYDLQTSDKIVGKAIMENGYDTTGDTWHSFQIPFTYNGEIDYDKYDYKLAIVFSSSRDGAYFEGAVGSKLLIDDVEIVCEPFK